MNTEKKMVGSIRWMAPEVMRCDATVDAMKVCHLFKPCMTVFLSIWMEKEEESIWRYHVMFTERLRRKSKVERNRKTFFADMRYMLCLRCYVWIPCVSTVVHQSWSLHQVVVDNVFPCFSLFVERCVQLWRCAVGDPYPHIAVWGLSNDVTGLHFVLARYPAS